MHKEKESRWGSLFYGQFFKKTKDQLPKDRKTKESQVGLRQPQLMVVGHRTHHIVDGEKIYIFSDNLLSNH